MKMTKKIITCITIAIIIISLVSLTVFINNYIHRDNYDDIFGKSLDGIIIFIVLLPFFVSLIMTFLSGYRYLKTPCPKSKKWYCISYVLSFIGILLYMFISIGLNLDAIIDFKSLFSSCKILSQYNISYIVEKVITIYFLIVEPVSILFYIIGKKTGNKSSIQGL